MPGSHLREREGVRLRDAGKIYIRHGEAVEKQICIIVQYQEHSVRYIIDGVWLQAMYG